ncbi:hypothetical protein GCM10027341_27160 [Spirosoma knui]
MIDTSLTAQQLFQQLNQLDESVSIEAKTGSEIDKSIMETVCAFANEPGLCGGFILLGVRQKEQMLFPTYEPIAVRNIDKLQNDLVTRCATDFNQPIRPDIAAETINGVPVLKVFVPELPQAQKPLFFKNLGLPRGAFRRIGAADLHCTEEDLPVFYQHADTFDASLISGSSLADVDEEAINYYRRLRTLVNAQAEELTFSDNELLQALGCVVKQSGEWKLTVAGLVLFGSKMAQRRLMPMMRVDYIRVPGNEWIADPDNRFQSVDMRGSLLLILQRLYALIADDLPKGFLLPEGEIQAKSTGLPGRALREALVNALMHRSFRVPQPVQVIRYGNRIEIRNPGYSLKAEELLGEPGSLPRNTYIATVFHETNLAETKGSGIRTMRRLLADAGLSQPTFESNHTANQFTALLLLHHFLSEDDLDWLALLGHDSLTNGQKIALIFVRETGAIDNSTYRQLTGVDLTRASMELRQLRDSKLLELKGKGRATYYVASDFLQLLCSKENQAPVAASLSAPNNVLTEPGASLIEPGTSLTEPGASLIKPGTSLIEPALIALSNQLPETLQDALQQHGRRSGDREMLEGLILALCAWRPLTLVQLMGLLNRSEKHLLHQYITPLREAGKLAFTIPDMPRHPEQAYKTVTNESNKD